MSDFRRDASRFASTSSMTRSEFVCRLRERMQGKTERTILPERPEAAARRVQADADLPELFDIAARQVGMFVYRAELDNWLDVLGELAAGQGWKHVAAAPAGDGFITAERRVGLLRYLDERGVRATSFEDEGLFNADAGVTGVACAVAESGSLVCESVVCPRGLSLIPPVHVALAGVSQLAPDLCDVFEQYWGDVCTPSGISLITGPSKTADIEGVLVQGVHGPREVHVILVEGA